MEFTVSIITSFIAIIVALISGLFSYFSSKRSAKVTAMQAYLGFLQQKLSKLEEALNFFSNPKIISSDNKSKQYSSIADTLESNQERCSHIITNYGYLFHQEREEYERLAGIHKIILISRNQLLLNDSKLDLSVKDEYKDLVLDRTALINTMIAFHNDVKELIINELNATYKRFEDLSLLE